MRTHNQKILIWLSTLIALIALPIIYSSHQQKIKIEQTAINQSTTTPNIQITIPERKKNLPTIVPKQLPENIVELEKTSLPTAEKISISFTAGTFSTSTKINIDSSAYDLMLALLKNGFEFESKNFGEGLGYFVTSINGTKNDERGATYWTLYINNKESPVGVSSYILKDKDLILWKFENRNL